MTFKTEQEAFWAGGFGDEYVDRNQGQKLIAANIALFSKIISRTSGIKSAIEFGANIGLNLLALKQLLPDVDLTAIEINQKAASQLKKIERVKVIETSILEYTPKKAYDLAFIKGVLIHINPDMLQDVYKSLYESSQRYLCVVEYYNPAPVEVNYRGHKKRLFKRDFAGELMDTYRDLKLIDYGFVYHRDVNTPQDDITWFLMEKV